MAGKAGWMMQSDGYNPSAIDQAFLEFWQTRDVGCLVTASGREAPIALAIRQPERGGQEPALSCRSIFICQRLLAESSAPRCFAV